MGHTIMFYVYIIESLSISKIRYVGYSLDVEKRLNAHNSGESLHTSKNKPWKLILSIGFESRETAQDFERYFKDFHWKSFRVKTTDIIYIFVLNGLRLESVSLTTFFPHFSILIS